MNIVVSHPKSGRAVSKKTDALPKSFLNKKIGDTVSLDEIGMEGFEARIAGGSDKEGFPMHPSISGVSRKKILSLKGTGFRQSARGIKMRKSVRANTVTEELSQLNVQVVKEGKAPFTDYAGQPKVKEEKKSVKEEMIEKSLAGVGDESVAQEAKKIKGKIKG